MRKQAQVSVSTRITYAYLLQKLIVVPESTKIVDIAFGMQSTTSFHESGR